MLRTIPPSMLTSAAVLLLFISSPQLGTCAEEDPEKPAATPAVPVEDPVAENAPVPAESAPADEPAPAEEAKADAPQKISPDELIQGFLKHVAEQPGVTDEQKAKVKELVESLQADPYAQDVIITLAERELSPEFSQALNFLAEEQLPEAQESLTALSKSKDPYLAAESSFYLARSYIMEDRYEEALPRLQSLGEEFSQHSPHSAEALFLKGVSEVRVLKRKEAAASLAAFLKQYPEASERMKIAAFRMLDLLEQTEDGSLRDVQALMEYSRRRLTLEVPDKETQAAQDKAVALLDKLIEKAEEQESKGSGKSDGQKKEQSKSQGNNQSESESQGSQSQSTSGQGGSNMNDQSPEKVVRELHGGPRTPWDHLRNKQREEKAFAALKTQFPGRYQRLVEQYFKSLQDENAGK